MPEAEIGLRLSLKERRETAQGLAEVEGGLDKVGDSAEQAGQKAEKSSKVWRGLRGALGFVAKGAGVALGALGALTATALWKGFNRLNAIDQATAKLDGLGHSGRTVNRIMRNALSSVRGTAFGLDEAATTAAGTVAAGIKPGRELTKTLKLVADAATIGGTSMAEMGAIFNKVAASNKIQGDVIAQLQDKGIPIVQLLAKELGVTASEVTELAKKGKVDFATFAKAMDSGLGGAAKESGKTFSGSLANVGASLGRIGAGLLGGVFPHLAPMFQGITSAMEPLEGQAAKLGDVIGAKVGPILEKAGPLLGRFIGWLTGFDYAGFFSGLGSGEGALSKLGGALRDLGGAIANVDFGKLGEAFASGASDTVTVFAVAIGWAADHVDTFAKMLPYLVAAFAAYKTAQAAANVLGLAHIPITTAQITSNFALAAANRRLAAQMALTTGVERVGMLTRIRATVATVAGTAAGLAASAASKAWAAAQWVLNAALTANPIGLIIVGIAALVGGLILAWRKSETFRDIVTGAFGKVKDAALWAIDWIKGNWPKLLAILTGPIGIAVYAIARNWDRIKAGAAAVKEWITARFDALVGFFRGLPGRVTDAAKGMWDGVKSSARGAINFLIDAWNRLDFSIDISIPSWVPGIGGKGFHVADIIPDIPRLATGGPVAAGMPYVVGDRGPRHAWELFVPETSGTVLPRIPEPAMPKAWTQAEIDTRVLDDDTELTAGPAWQDGPIVIQLVTPDRKVLAEVMLDGLNDKVARR